MNRQIARLTVVTSALCAAALAPTVSASAHEAEGGDGNACTVAGAVASATGLRYLPGTGTFTLRGTMDCTSKEFSHGELTGTGTGTLGCVGGITDAVLKVLWSNGKTSTIELKMGDFAYGTGGHGSVTHGALAGRHVGTAWGREAAGAEATCATDAVHSYQFAGGAGFYH
jgi:hypothetical protein